MTYDELLAGYRTGRVRVVLKPYDNGLAIWPAEPGKLLGLDTSDESTAEDSAWLVQVDATHRIDPTDDGMRSVPPIEIDFEDAVEVELSS